MSARRLGSTSAKAPNIPPLIILCFGGFDEPSDDYAGKIHFATSEEAGDREMSCHKHNFYEAQLAADARQQPCRRETVSVTIDFVPFREHAFFVPSTTYQAARHAQSTAHCVFDSALRLMMAVMMVVVRVMAALHVHVLRLRLAVGCRRRRGGIAEK